MLKRFMPSWDRKKTLIGCAIFLSFAVVIAVVWHNWLRAVPLLPPEIDLAAVDSRVAKAIREARRAVVESPRSAPAWGKLGMVLVAHGFPTEGNECLAEAEKLDSKEPRWPYLQGVTLLQGEPEAALEKLKRAAVLRPDLPPVRLRLGEALLEQGQLDEAEEQFRRVLEQDPDNSRMHLDLGRLAFFREQWQYCLDHLKRAAGRFPNEAHALLAQVHQRLGNTAAATQEVPLINDADEPDFPDPYVDEVDQLRVGPQALIGLADQLRQQGRGKEAVAVLEKLVREEPESARSWEKLGKALIYMGKNPAAEIALREAARLAPDSFEPRFFLGVAQFRLRKARPQNLEAAIASFQQAARINPADAAVHYSLALCWQEQSHEEDALAAFRLALRYKPDFADAHFHLGQVLAQRGKTAEAIGHLEDSIRLAPTNSEAKKLLEQLRKGH